MESSYSKVWIVYWQNTITKSESEITDFSFSGLFVCDKFLYKLSLINLIKENEYIGKKCVTIIFFYKYLIVNQDSKTRIITINFIQWSNWFIYDCVLRVQM